MPELPKSAGGTLFHILTGESGFMYEVDRRIALSRFPDEYKERPFTAKEVEAYNKKRTKQAKGSKTEKEGEEVFGEA